MTDRRRTLGTVSLAVCCTGLGGTPIWLLSAHAPAMGGAAGFDDAGLGLLVSAFFLSSAVSGMAASRFVQVRGWPAGVVAAGSVGAVASLGVALLPASVALLLALLVAGAVANATSQPAANLAVALTVPSARQGLAFGVKQAALPVATFLVGVTLPLFLGEDGWRWAYGWAAALGLVMAGTVVVVRRRGRDARAVPSRGTATAPAEPRSSSRVDEPYRRALVLLSVGGGFGTACTMSLGGFFVVSAVADGWSLPAAGRLLAAASVVGVASRVVSGLLADRRTGRHLVVVAAMMLSGVTGLVLLAVGGSTAVTVLGALLAYGLGWSWNGVFAFAVVRYSGGAPAVATGMVQTAMSVGAAGGPLGFGLLATTAGYSSAWLVAAVSLATGAVFVLLGRRALPPDAARSRSAAVS